MTKMMQIKKVNTEPVTMDDVGRHAGVSVSTVSIVLRGASSKLRIAKATQERVRTAALELGYRPNAIARSLRTHQTNLIGLYSGFGDENEFMLMTSAFNAEVTAGLQKQCGLRHHELVLHGGFRKSELLEVFHELSDGRIGGLVLISPPDDRLVELLTGSSLPAVAVANMVSSLPSVVVDDNAGGRLLAEYLANKGHRRVLYRKGIGFSHTQSLCQRLAAFRECAAGYGMAVTEAFEEDNGWALGQEERVLLTASPDKRPTAAVCWHDTSAYGLIKLCEPLGLRVPQDLAIVGFNGIDTDASRLCSLTTIRAPWSEVGQRAIKLLFELMNGHEVPHETVLPVELMEGDTT